MYSYPCHDDLIKTMSICFNELSYSWYIISTISIGLNPFWFNIIVVCLIIKTKQSFKVFAAPSRKGICSLNFFKDFMQGV